jgi:hypothetical protein
MKNCRGIKNQRADECPWHEQKNKLKKTSATTKMGGKKSLVDLHTN